MRHVLLLFIMILCGHFTLYSQEENKMEIPFKKGVLKICSIKRIIVNGYEGETIIIKKLNQKTQTDTTNNVAINDTLRQSTTYLEVKETTKGLQKVTINSDDEFPLKIEQKDRFLTISDDYSKNLESYVETKGYEILIPNSIDLIWTIGDCKSDTLDFVGEEKPCELNNFSGEAEISSALYHFKITDVKGPLSINTIGGDVIIIFKTILPTNLYSVYSDNGAIDVTLPETSNINIASSSINFYSNINFDITSKKQLNRALKMNLKLGTGKAQMILATNIGDIFLRKL